MLVIHLPGQTLMDREALAQWTGRSVHTIRARCRPVERHSTGRQLYDADEAARVLDAIPKRRTSPT